MNPGSRQEMVTRGEILVSGCPPGELDVLRGAAGPKGPHFRTLESPFKLAQQAVERPPLAVILGVGRKTLGDLDMISVIRAIRRSIPVIVIAREDSLTLERRAREAGVFYYLVHPIDRTEVEAVFKAVFRYEEGARGGSESP